MTLDSVVSYRTYLAVSHAARVILWTGWIVLVTRATVLQDAREMAVNAQQTEGERTRAFTAIGENLRAATRNCAVAMLAAGDPTNGAARIAVIDLVRNSGMERYDDTWLAHDLNESSASRVSAYLAPLKQSLNQEHKEALVRQVAAIGFADGLLTTGQTSVLETMGASVGLGAEDMRGILDASTISPEQLAPDEAPGGSIAT